MNGKNYLLDTNAIIAIMDEDENILNWLDRSLNIYYSPISLGELYYGIEKSSPKKKEENYLNLKEILRYLNTLEFNDDTAVSYSKIKKDLNEKGKPIPENDIWIAAFTKSYKQILVSNDDHFSYINDLEIFNWK